MPRLFVAIDLPDEVKTQLSRLSSGVPGARWVKSEQMHVTLQFIGEIDDTQFKAIKSALAGIQAAGFEMKLEGVGQFPPKGAPRVLWAGIRASDELRHLQAKIEMTMRQLGFRDTDHPLSAHITLARFKMRPEREAVEAYFAQHIAFETATFSINQFVLYSSVLRHEGSAYKYEAVYALTPK